MPAHIAHHHLWQNSWGDWCAAREIASPATGWPLQLPEKDSVSFRPAADPIDALNR